ncbi:HAMP domain-containing sensor histidine kinase [Bacillus haimaensis]|uniref:sensor histidine kinase n=1 Tax=Bacillus haimaensis TaxID=3160967 RepID=UPI003AA89B08
MKRRVILHYMVLITVTLVLIEGLLFFTVNRFYYHGVAQSIIEHAETSVHVYEQSHPEQMVPLHSHARVIMELFTMDNIDLSLFTLNGNQIATSSGILPKNEKKVLFEPKIISGESYFTIEKQEKERTMSVYAPLIERGQVVGVLQYHTSLKRIDDQVFSLYRIFLLIGLSILAIVFFISQRLANSIVMPVKELIDFSERMAHGNFNTRINETYRDELKTLAGTLNKMADEIVQSNQLKHDFISSVSHELRTPLTSIMGWVETLNEDITVEEKALAVNIISKEANRLTLLVEELLDFSKLQGDRMKLNRTELNINSLLFHVALQMKNRALQKNVMIELNGGKKEYTILGDEYKLRQVFINILDNAIKFSKENGKVEVRLNEKKDKLLIEIKDNGIGIPKEKLIRVTEMFYQAHPEKTGTGLGLAISKKIVELHGGEISIDSEEGRGSSVKISLNYLE